MQTLYSPNTDLYKAALAYHQKKEYVKAKPLYLAVLKRQPERAEAWVNLASVCDALGESKEALAHVEHAIRLNPTVQDGYFNQGVILQHLNRFLEAIQSFQMSVRHSPQDHDAYYYLGQCYFSISRFSLALDAYAKASDICPTLASIYGAGKSYKALQRLEQAVVCFNECIKINPQDKAARIQLAFCYRQLQDYPKLAALITEFQSLPHLNLQEQHELWFSKQQLALWSDDEALTLASKIEKEINHNARLSLKPWSAMGLALSLENRLIFAQRFAKGIEEKYHPLQRPHSQSHARSQRLKIGYLSMDFRVHPMAFLIQSVLALHDRTRFEVFAYSYGADDKSDIRKRIEQSVEHFVDLKEDDVLTAAHKIAIDDIDILIDLAGFTADNRFAILTLKPAPIQVNYLGYVLSTGSRSIDYFLADKTLIQAEEESYYSEKIAYLPYTFISINHQEQICTELAGTRADWGLPEAKFVYGCFNAIYKIEVNVFDAWMKILSAVPNSVLWLLSQHDIIEQNLKQEAQKRGVDPNRLIFSPYAKRAMHLARHSHMDLFLDTWQVNAITTACDAICAGVPVLTLAGDYTLSRAAKSIMQAAGLASLMQAFIAQNREDYQQKAINFGLHHQAFSTLKKKFQEQLPDSPLFDMPGRVKAFEAAYEKMWDIYERGLAPQSFTVDLKTDECIV